MRLTRDSESTPHLGRTRAALVLVALAATLAACTGSDKPEAKPTVEKVPAIAPGASAKPDFDHTTLKPNVVKSTQAQSDAVTVKPDRLEFPASDVAEVVKQWPAGAPVVGNRKAGTGTGSNPFGYLRKVKSVTTEGDKVVVLTEPAVLADVLDGEAQLTADPHAAIPVDTTGVDLSQYFVKSNGAPQPLPGATDGGVEGGEAGAMAIRPPPHKIVIGGTRRSEPIGSVRQAFSVSGAWSDVKQAGSDVGGALSDGASAAASAVGGLPGVEPAYDMAEFFNVSGTQTLWNVDDAHAAGKLYTPKKVGAVGINVAFSGKATLTGQVVYAPTFHIAAKIGLGLEEFEASATGDLTIGAQLDVDTRVTPAASGDVTSEADLAKLIEADPEANEIEVTLLESEPYVGPVVAGIPTTYQLELKGDCKLVVATTMKAHAEGTLYAPGSSVGVKYAPLTFPQWQPTGNFDFKTSGKLTVSGGGGTTLECGITPTVNWLFGGVAGPALGLRNSIKAAGTYVESCDPKAQTSKRADGNATLEVDPSVAVEISGDVKAWSVVDLTIGPYTVYQKDFPPLVKGAWTFPGKGMSWCASHCDDAATDGDETAVDCGGAVCAPCATGAPCSKGSDCTSGFCVSGACVGPCANGVKDGAETGVDCGGSCPTQCGDGGGCSSNLDCATGFCMPATHVCGSSCADGVQDYGESDVDCGGPCATRCPISAHCNLGGDCATGVCNYDTALCIQTPCIDGTKDFGEADVDCGHVCATLCAVSSACQADADCASGICSTSGKCVATRCQDGLKDGTELDVDCGGACGGCADGSRCKGASDCLSGLCHAYKFYCTSDHCDDGVKDGDETGFDCGGSKCGPCGLGKACGADKDCASGFCSVGNTCVQSQCADGRKNGDEVDVDCGGSKCTLACAQGRACSKPADCLSGLCSAQTGKCIGNRCLDTVMDGDESGVDCGGSCGARCQVGQGCHVAGDCASGICNQQTGLCAADACHDGARNGAETAIDCGGGTCAPCGIGGACVLDTDCTGVCGKVSKTCVASHCFDQAQDVDETALDCGGALCAGCQVGVACALDRDCGSNACGANGKCAPSKCADGKQDGGETAIDCGGSCTGCGVGVACATGNDCASGSCSAGTHLCIAGCTSGADCGTTICNLTSGTCVASLCQDGVLDGKETALDCGGGCAGCAVDAACGVGTDCASGACNVSTLLCVADHCSDQTKSADETDVDCGGALCTTCATGLGCSVDTDCQSGACNQTTHLCVTNHCSDGRADVDETGQDCGGALCGHCANGLGCSKAADCASGFCSLYTHLCVADHCVDGVTDGGEGATDCGYSCTNQCYVGQTCNGPGDCTSLDCKAGFCVTPPPEKTCLDHYKEGKTTDGQYTVYLDYMEFPAWCDMTGGGWMIAWAKDSANLAMSSYIYNGTQANREATSHMGDHWYAPDSLGAFAPEVRSLSTNTNLWTAVPTMDLRSTVPAGSPPPPAYTELRFTAYEQGNKIYNSGSFARSSLLIDFGYTGQVIWGPTFYWCRGNPYYYPANDPSFKYHSSLGDGFDFSTSTTANMGITMAEGFEMFAGGNQYTFDNEYGFATWPTPAVITTWKPGENTVLWVR